MEPFVTRITALMVVVLHSLLLLLLQTSSVQAVDVLGYTNNGGCSGSAIGCYGIKSGQCCYFPTDKPAMRVRNMQSCQRAWIYQGYHCDVEAKGVSTTDKCWYGYGPISGCRWAYYCTTSTSATEEGSEVCGLPGADSATCNSTTLPNAVMYSTSGSTPGTWILTMSSDKVDDMLEQLDKVPVDQKVVWLESAGAHFDPDQHTAVV